MLMSPPSTIEVLNRLLVLHERSLPMYLSYAAPDRMRAQPEATAVLGQIVEDQKRTIDRLATIVLDSGGMIDSGEFPMAFTGLHDLSLEYLLKLMVERQKKLVAACENLANLLAAAPYAQAAAREALGEAKGHLQNLDELKAKIAGE